MGRLMRTKLVVESGQPFGGWTVNPIVGTASASPSVRFLCGCWPPRCRHWRSHHRRQRRDWHRPRLRSAPSPWAGLADGRL